MDVKRAQDIVQSERTIDVVRNGEAVWIDRVNADANTVTIHALNKPGESMTVPAGDIREA